MTPERTKELLPVMTAFAEGREIQFKLKVNDQWKDRKGASLGCSWEDDFDYRIKPVPELALVPLGDNVTRNGRKARVICIDRNHPGNGALSVVAMLRNLGQDDSPERLFGYNKYGGHCNNTQLDLVGHLPPDPQVVETGLNSLLGELQTWQDSKHRDRMVEALKNFAGLLGITALWIIINSLPQ